jgi:cytochrome c553
MPFASFPRIAAALALACAAVGAGAQTALPGDANAGEALWNANGCSGCHTLSKARTDITNRAPAGMSFSKALAALNAALNGADLDGNVTGMAQFAPGLTTANRNDLAAYIAGLSAPAPVISFAPAGGAIFPATAIGASASATVTVTNTGTAPLTFVTNNAVTVATGGDAADFRVTASSCPGVTLQPGSGNCTVNVAFTPTAGTALTRTASIGLSTTTLTRLVPLQGTVMAGAAPATPPAGGGSAANPPTGGGGGGALDAALGVLALALLARRRAIARTAAQLSTFCGARNERLPRS